MWSGVGVVSELLHWMLELRRSCVIGYWNLQIFGAFTNIKWNSWKCVSIRSEK